MCVSVERCGECKHFVGLPDEVSDWFVGQGKSVGWGLGYCGENDQLVEVTDSACEDVVIDEEVEGANGTP